MNITDARHKSIKEIDATINAPKIGLIINRSRSSNPRLDGSVNYKLIYTVS